MTILELGTNLNWNLSYPRSQVFAPTNAQGNPLRIPETFVPIQFTSRIIAILHESDFMYTTRRFACFLNYKINLGFTQSGNPDVDVSPLLKTYLNRITFFKLPSLVDFYGLSFTPHWTYTNIATTIWEYIGPAPDDLDDHLIRIESKIDALQEE